MSFRIIVKPDARKNLKKIPAEHRKRIYHTLMEIGKNPFAAKKLHGKYRRHYVVRVWPYRIVYKILQSESLIDVIHISHRQGIY